MTLVLLILSFLLFGLAALGVRRDPVNFVAAGLAAYIASLLVGAL